MSAAKEASIRSAAVDWRSDGWLEETLENLRFAVVEGVLDDELIEETREAMYDTQQRIHAEVGEERLERAGLPVECPAGSMIEFDSTLLHAAGENVSGHDRLAINQQFSRSYVKQQVDYVRALGEERVLELEERAQQLLGGYTRVVTSLDEYYRPPEERLSRSGQG